MKWRNIYTLLINLFLWYIIIMLCSSLAHGKDFVDVNKLATAIYYAEGGAKTRHPYGILAKYKHTTPRQACINTILHALKDYTGEKDVYQFIVFLGSRYAPIGASNDPTGLNRNWVSNVYKLYNKGVRVCQ